MNVTRGAHISGGCGTCMQHDLCMENFAAAARAIEDVQSGEAKIDAVLSAHPRHVSLDAERDVVMLRDCQGQNVAVIALTTVQSSNTREVLAD